MQKNIETKNHPTVEDTINHLKDWIGQPYEKDNHFIFLKWRKKDEGPGMEMLGISNSDDKKKKGIYDVMDNEDLITEYDNWDNVLDTVIKWFGDPDKENTYMLGGKWSNQDDDFHSFDLHILTDEEGFVYYNVTTYDIDNKDLQK